MGSESIQDLRDEQARQKIRELVEHARTCIMLTELSSLPISARPMSIQKVNESGELLFFSHRYSEKNKQLQDDDHMQIIISNDGNSEYLNLFGKAWIYRDQQEIDDLYSAFANNWFEGKNDPNLTLIRFVPVSGHYWDSKHGKIVQLIGMLAGAITGKQSDDGIEGDLSTH